MRANSVFSNGKEKHREVTSHYSSNGDSFETFDVNCKTYVFYTTSLNIFKGVNLY